MAPAAVPDVPARDAAAAAESIDQRLLQWMDAEKVDGFVTWTPFTHPTLGQVEIGGFKPYATTNPPAAKIAELGAAHTKFVLHLTSLFPKVRVAKAEADRAGGRRLPDQGGGREHRVPADGAGPRGHRARGPPDAWSS